MNLKETLDRIEDKMAVLLVRLAETTKIKSLFPCCLKVVRKGDILDIEVIKDVEETEKAKERVMPLLEKMKKK